MRTDDDFEIQSVTTRAGGGMGLAQDRIPGPWGETPKVRGKNELCTDFFVYDGVITSEEVFDVVVDNPYAFTLTRMRIVNLSEALQTNCHVVAGIGGGGFVTFTSGDFGGAPDPNTYPTDTFGLPAGGVFDMYCDHPVPAGGFLQFNAGDFVDGGVIYSNLYAEFYYTYNCSDR